MTKHLPEEKECAIRINLALAMIGTMDEDYEAPQHVDTSLEILRRARDILLEKDCATESGDGHSETAEQLKEEIEAWMEQLDQQSETEPEENKGAGIMMEYLKDLMILTVGGKCATIGNNNIT